VHQLKGYETILRERREEVIAAYRKQCEYILRTQYASPTAPPETSKLAGRRSRLEFVVKHPDRLYLASLPRLLIYGFDDAQKKNGAWRNHLQKLNEILGGNRVMAKGNAADIRLEDGSPLNGEIWKPSTEVSVSELGLSLLGHDAASC
jgi:hypothetical protein